MDNLEATKTIQLRKSIKLDDKEITELTLREPTAGEMEAAEINTKSNNGRTIYLIGLVSGHHPNIIKQLGARDYTEASEYISDFLGSSRQTGES